MPSGVESPPKAAQENILAVAKLEQEFLAQRTLLERIADAIAGFVGSMPFVCLHLLWFAAWGAVNLGWFPVVTPFDPWPFILLALIVSCEGVLLSTFVLMKQNRMSLAADKRAHLNLQIDLLAEKEITKILQMQRLLCARLGVEEVLEDREVTDLSRETAVETLAEELHERLESQTE